VYVCLVCVKVHTFYEAVGLMINAQTETATQERLIEKYMQLPNQVWDNTITQATQASHSVHTVMTNNNVLHLAVSRLRSLKCLMVKKN